MTTKKTDTTPETAPDAPETDEHTDTLPTTTRARFVAAMREVGHVGKREQANMGRGGSFNFRGIDAVMNAVGPAFRKYGIFLMPELLSEEYERVPRGNGGMMVATRVRVCYHIMSETGDGEFYGTAIGEANDTADKATAKAMSVALRTFLLQSLVLPTDEPDPDLSYNEVGAHQQQRGQAPQGPADPGRLIYRDKAFNPQTADRATLLRAVWQAKQLGDRETYDRLEKVGKERFSGGKQEEPQQQQQQAPAPDEKDADVDPWANAPEAQA